MAAGLFCGIPSLPLEMCVVAGTDLNLRPPGYEFRGLLSVSPLHQDLRILAQTGGRAEQRCYDIPEPGIWNLPLRGANCPKSAISGHVPKTEALDVIEVFYVCARVQIPSAPPFLLCKSKACIDRLPSEQEGRTASIRRSLISGTLIELLNAFKLSELQKPSGLYSKNRALIRYGFNVPLNGRRAGLNFLSTGYHLLFAPPWFPSPRQPAAREVGHPRDLNFR
jgi:hypothetical protein